MDRDIVNGGRHYPPWNGRHVNVLGVEEQTAKSVAGLMFAVITLPLIAGGGLALAATGEDIREIYDMARAHKFHLRLEHKKKAETP